MRSNHKTHKIVPERNEVGSFRVTKSLLVVEHHGNVAFLVAILLWKECRVPWMRLQTLLEADSHA